MFEPKDAMATSNNISVKRIKGESYIGVEVHSEHHVETFLFSSVGKIRFDDINANTKWMSYVKDHNGVLIKSTHY